MLPLRQAARGKNRGSDRGTQRQRSLKAVSRAVDKAGSRERHLKGGRGKQLICWNVTESDRKRRAQNSLVELMTGISEYSVSADIVGGLGGYLMGGGGLKGTDGSDHEVMDLSQDGNAEAMPSPGYLLSS